MALEVGASKYAHAEGVIPQDVGTFVGWFAPSFTINDATQRFFFDCDNVRYSLSNNTGTPDTLTATADNRSFDFTGAWTTDEWTHIAFSFNKGDDTLRVWINGSELTSTGDSGSWGSAVVDPSDRLFIGKKSTSGGNFTGKLAEIAVYDAELTTTEIADLAKSFSPLMLSSRDDLIVYWDFIRNDSSTQRPRFGDVAASIIGSPSTLEHPRMFYPSNQLVYEPPKSITPPVAGRISETLYAGTAINSNVSGTVAWTNPTNVGSDDSLYATVTVPSGSISNILRTGQHGFNIPPEGIIEGVQIQAQFILNSNFLNVFQIYNGSVYGTPIGQVVVGGAGTANLIYGSNTEKWGLTLTPNVVNGTNFGFGFIVDSSTIGSGATVQVDFLKITVHWSSVGAVTYTEIVGGGLEASGVISDPYRQGVGGATASGSAVVSSTETKFPESQGVVGGGRVLVSPYIIGEIDTELTGGIECGGKAKLSVDVAVFGGIVGGGIAVKGYSSPVISSGLLGGGTALLSPIYGLGGATLGGVAESGAREASGGAEANGTRVEFVEYTHTPIGGLLGGGKVIRTTTAEIGDGGAECGGRALPKPYYIGEFGTELTGGALLEGTATVPGNADGGAKFSGLTVTPQMAFDPQLTVGAKASGLAFNRLRSFHRGTGGSVGGGTAFISFNVAVRGGILVGRNPENIVTKKTTPIPNGGTKVSGAIKMHYSFVASGTILTGGTSEVVFGRKFLPDGNSNSGAGVIIEEITMPMPQLKLNVNWAFTGSTILSLGSAVVIEITYNYNTLGGISLEGHAVSRVTYLGLVGNGEILISGASASFPIKNYPRAKYNTALNLKSNNMIKDLFNSVQTQLEEENELDRDPNLEKVNFSDKVLLRNKIQDGYLPTATVVRQRKHLPTPKKDAENRSTQIAQLS